MKTIETLKEVLTKLKEVEQGLRNDISENIKNQSRTRIEIFEIKSGLKIGDKVKFKYGRDFKSGILNGYDTRYGSVYCMVKEFKKDGTVGLRTTSVYQRDISKFIP